MRLTLTFALTLVLAALAGCSAGSNDQAPPQSASAPATDAQNRAGGATAEVTDGYMKTVSLQQTDDATTPTAANAPAVERKIIRNASLTLEVEQPTKAMQLIASIAEARGGFVVTSDSVRHVGTKGSKSYEVVTV